MGDLIASAEDCQAFASLPADQRKVTPALRGVVAEIATSATLRYPWPVLRPLLAELMEQVLVDFEADSHVEVGPAPPGGNAEEAKEARLRLGKLLEGHTRGPPFTLQRLAELLLEPRKQYSRLHKLVLALEKLLMVVSVVSSPAAAQLQPRPRIADLPPVNENPPPPEAPAAGAAPRANGPLANDTSDSAVGARGGFTSAMHAAAETAFINSVFVDATPDPASSPQDSSPSSPPQQAADEQSAKAEDASNEAAGAPPADADMAMAETSPAQTTDAAGPSPTKPPADALPAATPAQPVADASIPDQPAQPDATDSAAIVAASASDETKAKAASELPLTTTETAEPMES